MDTASSPPARPFLWPDLVLTIASQYSEPEQLYLVGGVVRDALIGYPIHDIDIATAADGLAVARQIAAFTQGAFYPIDRERRTGRVIIDTSDSRQSIDVTSFRGETLLDDLTGRDFTINAMAVNLSHLTELIDPLRGYPDFFEQKVLRQCTHHSIQDDPVRALRAIRHALNFSLRIEPDTLKSIKATSGQLSHPDGKLNQPERCRDEFFKSLSAKSPAGMLRLLNSTGLLPALTPFPLPAPAELRHRFTVVEKIHNLFQIISPQRNDNTAADLTLGVAVMVLDRYRSQLQEYLSQQFADGRSIQALLLIGAFTPRGINPPGETWAKHLHLSNNEAHVVDKLAIAADFAWNPAQSVSARDIHRYYRRSGETGIGGVLLYLAEYLAKDQPLTQPEAWGSLLENFAAPLLEAFFKHHQEIIAPPPLITGDMLLHSLDIEPGPLVGRILTRLLEEQAAGAIKTKKEALSFAEHLLQQYEKTPDQGPTSQTNGS